MAKIDQFECVSVRTDPLFQGDGDQRLGCDQGINAIVGTEEHACGTGALLVSATGSVTDNIPIL
jgi:hypothetical protein